MAHKIDMGNVLFEIHICVMGIDLSEIHTEGKGNECSEIHKVSMGNIEIKIHKILLGNAFLWFTFSSHSTCLIFSISKLIHTPHC
jgi:hypothetical protein